MAKQVDLLFGVKGGASVSGESGALIKTQIEGIVKELNDSKIPALQFNIDQNALKKQVAEIKNLLKDIDLSKIETSPIKEGRFKIKAGELRAYRNQYDALAMSIAQVNKIRYDMRSLDKTGAFSELSDAIAVFDKGTKKLMDADGNLLPIDSAEMTFKNLREVESAYKAVRAAAVEATTASKINGNVVKEATSKASKASKQMESEAKKAQNAIKTTYGNLGSMQASFNKKILGFGDLDDTSQKRAAQVEIDNFKKLLAELSDGNGGFKALNLEDEKMVGTVDQIFKAWKRVKNAIEEATTASKANGNQTKEALNEAKRAQKEQANEAKRAAKKAETDAKQQIDSVKREYGNLGSTQAAFNKKMLGFDKLDNTPQKETALTEIEKFQKLLGSLSDGNGGFKALDLKDEQMVGTINQIAEAWTRVKNAMQEATTASAANGNQIKKDIKDAAAAAKKAASDAERSLNSTKKTYGNLGSIQASFNKRLLDFAGLDDSDQKAAAKEEIESFQKLLNELSDGKGGLKALNLEDEQMVGIVNQIPEAWKRVKVAIDEATTASKAHGNQLKAVAGLTEKLGADGLGFLTGEKNDQFDLKKYEDIVAQFRKVGKGLIFSGNNNQYTAMSDAIKNADALLQTMRGKDGVMYKLEPKYVEKYGQLAEYLKIIQQNAGRIKSSGDDLGMEKVVDKLHTFGQSLKNLENYPRLMNQYKELEASLKNGTVTTLEEANKKLLDFKNACADAGVQVNSLADDILNGITNQLEYLVRAFVAGAIASKLREIYTNVVAIDSAMTELKKVTDATEQEYIRFMDNATERANKLGASVREVVNASADYARLGYSIDEASDLADSAIIYKNVGDGLEGIDQATEHLISTMKAFGIEAKDSMRIVDVFNEVANHFPTSAAGIGEGMQRSAAALASAGNSLEESVAIFTAAQSIAQDSDVVGISKCADFKDNYIG